MVIYLIQSEQVATWPIFPLSSHNDLQISISNMASSKNIVRLNAEIAPSCFDPNLTHATTDCSQSLFFRKIVEIEHFALRAAILEECQNYSGGRGRCRRKREKQSLSSFDAHPRWLPVTQSLLRQDSIIILMLQNSVGTFDHWSSQSLPKEISGAGKQHFPACAPRSHQVGLPSAVQLSSLLACETFFGRYIIIGALKWNGL